MENTTHSEIKGQRTLATVVFTDCVGFSARMSEDEEHTLGLIRRDLKMMKRVCEAFEGKVLKSTGDGLLMYFLSAVKAVECAVEIQKKIGEEAETRIDRDILRHRIGVHLADMFITETDVMGNGVNIAARLQSEADPGGICMSQTVYDVVKSGLQLPTKYIGARELKNIREVVPAYKILLNPDEKDEFGEAANRLEQNKNLVRIKKLLFYICKNVWENDQSKLEGLKVQDLLQDLIKITNSAEQLRTSLDAAVKNLSKPTEYSLVASIILDEANKLYPNQRQQTSSTVSQSAANLVSSPDLQLQYAQIAQALEQSPNLTRIKKLLFYICKNRWENDSQELSPIRLQDLIADLHQVATTSDRLKLTLENFVQTLSKRAEYVLIADAIFSSLQPLYSSGAEATSVAAVATPAPPPAPKPLSPEVQRQLYAEIISALEHEQNLLRIKKLMLYVCKQQWESNAATLNNLEMGDLVQQLHHQIPTAAKLEAALSTVVEALSKPAEYRAIAQAIFRQFGKLYPDYTPDRQPAALLDSTASSQTELQAKADHASHFPAKSQPLSLFDARLEIMKYVNPLRAKILLFSALQSSFAYTYQDWLNLRMWELDSLLRQLLTTCTAYTDMEDLLYRTARNLSEPDEQVQIATRIIKSLRLFYLQGGVAISTAPRVDDTSIGSHEFQETRLRALGSATDEDFTCQLMLAGTSQQPGVQSTQLLSAASPSEPTPDANSSSENTHLCPPSNRGDTEHAPE